MKIHNHLLPFFICLSFEVMCQVPEPAKDQDHPIAVTGATIHTGTGSVLENATLKFESGKITYVGIERGDLDGFEEIDASGKHVYPGFILPNTLLGLVDINAVRPTRDYQEVGDFKPHIRSLVAYNTDSEVIPTFRFNGILLAQSTPRGGAISGTSSIMMLEGWNWEDAVFKEDDGIHLNWPSLSFGPRWWLGETERRPNKRYGEQVLAIKQFFTDLKGYVKGNGPTTNLLMEASTGLLSGEKILHLHADHAKAIVEAITFFKENDIPKIVLVGGRDAWRVVDLLKSHDIPVILGDVHERPFRDDEDIDLAYKMPSMLADAGIKVALGYENLQSSRNLPFFAGTASTYGLDKEDALKMITSNTAEILGIADRAGSLAVGKDAIFFISEGDALDMRTSKLTHAFIQGKEIDLKGKQQLLYERFKRKYQESE